MADFINETIMLGTCRVGVAQPRRGDQCLRKALTYSDERLQVLTLVTPDGAYGGPAQVAFNQASEIRAQGYSLTIAGGCMGYRTTPETLYGTSVRLCRCPASRAIHGARGHRRSVGDLLILKNRRNIDAVHVHLGRDLVSMPAALLGLLLKKRVILQPTE